MKIRMGSSLDIPIISKKIYWATLGPLFIFIGAIPLLMEAFLLGIYNTLTFVIIFFVGWIFISLWLFVVVSVPRTKVLKEGLRVRSTFLRRGRSYKWGEFKAFTINQKYLTGRFFLFLYLLSKDGHIQVGLGKQNPESVSSFLRQTAELPERGPIEEENCIYHPQESAIASCEGCGAFICRNCFEYKIYAYILSFAPHLDVTLACLPCYYNQYRKGSKVALLIGFIFGIFILALPYYDWILLFNSINAIVAPIFLGVALGAFLANRKRLHLMEAREIAFPYEEEKSLNKLYLLTSIILSIIIPLRLTFLGTFYWATSTFHFHISTIVFIVIHQILQWMVYLKFRP